MHRRNGHNWLVWNLPNIISSLRFLAPLVLFGTSWSIEGRMIAYVLLTITDALDGFVARMIGNTGGIGRFIDSVADKVMHGSGLLFLLLEAISEDWIVGLMILGEVIIVIPVGYAIYLLVKRESKKGNTIQGIYAGIKEEIIKGMDVCFFGRVKMISYGIGSGFVFFHILNRGAGFFSYGYRIIFLAGITFCFMSILEYYKKFIKWHENFLKSSSSP